MRGGDGRLLLRIAEEITDGVPVDWQEGRQLPEPLRQTVEQLRIIAAVAAVHRGLLSPTFGAAGQAVAKSTGGADSLTTEISVPEPVSTWGPLRALERLGQGGFGEVWRAYDPALQREVALKLRRVDRFQEGQRANRFLREARRLARVRHPNVLVVHGADMHDGRVGLWTDLVRGRTLEEILAEQGPLGAHEAALIGIDVCRALAAVHAAGLVHRDVKTSNIMREQGGRIVLLDFGSVIDHAPASARKGEEPVTGTPLFMAPEVLRDEEAGPAADIYSLGVVLYRLASGRFPVTATNLSELLERHAHGALVPLRDARPDLPTAFIQVVERALDPHPLRRYSSAGEMERALATTLGSQAPVTVSDRVSGVRRGWRPVWLPLAAVLAVAGVAVGVWLSLLSQRTLVAELTLYRLKGGVEERLLPGAGVEPGDRLAMEIQGRESICVYVLSEDEAGEAFVLFPAGLDLKNPLAPGIRHRLPGQQAGKQMTWEVSSAGGRETIVVIASRRPLTELESDIARIPRAAPREHIAYRRLSQETVSTLRGIGVVAPAEPGAPARESAITRALSALSRRAEHSKDPWVWQIQLTNPGR